MNRLFWIILMTILVINIEAKQEKIAIAMMFQNEAPYLKEWIEYHRLVGAKHFYLWNNQSEDDYLSVLTPYIEKGIVELFQAPEIIHNISEQIRSQGLHMGEALRMAEGKHDWLIMIDADEFVVPMQKNTIQEVLKDYKEFPGVAVQWVCFGTSNVEKIPKDKLMIEILTYRGPFDFAFNGTPKWIVRPERTLEIEYLYNNAIFKGGNYGVDQNKRELHGLVEEWKLDPVKGPDKIRLNHYWSRDEDYFNQIKIPRQAKWDNVYLDKLLQCKTTLNTYKDDSMQRFIHPLRKRMFAKKK